MTFDVDYQENIDQFTLSFDDETSFFVTMKRWYNEFN